MDEFIIIREVFMKCYNYTVGFIIGGALIFNPDFHNLKDIEKPENRFYSEVRNITE